jgi:hypothetical protein
MCLVTFKTKHNYGRESTKKFFSEAVQRWLKCLWRNFILFRCCCSFFKGQALGTTGRSSNVGGGSDTVLERHYLCCIWSLGLVLPGTARLLCMRKSDSWLIFRASAGGFWLLREKKGSVVDAYQIMAFISRGRFYQRNIYIMGRYYWLNLQKTAEYIDEIQVKHSSHNMAIPVRTVYSSW